MTVIKLYEDRKTAIHMLRKGCKPQEVAQELNHSIRWVYKWKKRYEEEEWIGLKDRSRARKTPNKCISPEVQQAIKESRSELEAEVEENIGLKYIGAPAVLGRLVKKKVKPLPSISSIERVLRKAKMTKNKTKSSQDETSYPRLQPNRPHQLIQVDIVPHYLRGGESVACFNGLDVVSRYPTGQAFAQRRVEDARAFLIQVWQEIGLPHYTQVDNEGCFSGGFTHKGVLGQVLRLALWVGTELVFSPIRHPQSNGFVERFHQDYDAHVWEDTCLKNIDQVNQQGTIFFQNYRHSGHHSALKGHSPTQTHFQYPPKLLPSTELPEGKLPLTEGKIHFMRQVKSTGNVSVLNLDWSVPNPDPLKGVWVTINFSLSAATLHIYDAAPDVDTRLCLATYPFPLSETIYPRPMPIQTDFPDQSQNPYLLQLPLELFTFFVNSSVKMLSGFGTMC